MVNSIFYFVFSDFVLFKYIFLILGSIGITTDTSWPEPGSDTKESRETSERAMQFYVSISHHNDK